ncbi:MAG: methyltransferase domain-containing protein [Anaerolineae bacterium]|nr:methyltransferase domain-containing protein [Anaerolineae bacterium]
MSSLLRDLLTETWRGKSLARTMFNRQVKHSVKMDTTGIVLDLGGGQSPSYYRFWGYSSPPENVIRVDIVSTNRPTLFASLEHPLPVNDNVSNQVFLFNVLEHIFHHKQLLDEIHRILKPGGEFFLYVPFLINIHADPHDYFRYSASALERLLESVGFKEYEIIAHASLWYVITQFSLRLVPTRFLKTIYVLIAFCLDRLLRRLAPNLNDKFVLGYFVAAKKTASSTTTRLRSEKPGF